jgi:hypothetical protein
MANQVPDTDNFNLQNVVDVTGGSDLVAAFSNSNDAFFNSTYKGSKDRLSNFRAYDAVIITNVSANASTITVTYTSGSYYDVRLTVTNQGSNNGYSQKTTGSSPDSLDYSGGSAFSSPIAWNFKANIGGSWITVGSGSKSF